MIGTCPQVCAHTRPPLWLHGAQASTAGRALYLFSPALLPAAPKSLQVPGPAFAKRVGPSLPAPPPPCPGPAAAGNESAFITPNVSGVEGFSGDNSVYCQGPRNKVWKRSLQGLRSCERGGWRRHNHTQRSSEEPSSSSRHWTHGETAAPCTLAVEEWKPRSVCQIPEGGQSQGLFRADAGGHMWSARSPRAKQDGC